jgi:hypothetical protein
VCSLLNEGLDDAPGTPFVLDIAEHAQLALRIAQLRIQKTRLGFCIFITSLKSTEMMGNSACV